MRILNYKMICPKCKKEYINRDLASFSSGMEEAANSFVKNNVNHFVCEDCNVKLVQERLIENFDNGVYSPKLTEMHDINDLFDLYLKTLNNIHDFFECINDGKIILTAKVIKDDNKISTCFCVTGLENNINHELLVANLDEYQFAIGDRRNNFMAKSLINATNALITCIYDYIFFDDCNHYNDEDKSRILKELIELN